MKAHTIIMMLAAACILAGCQSQAVKVTPVKLPNSFTAGGKIPLGERWWLSLGDKDLNALIERALKDNFSLKTAWDRLAQARATVAAQGAGTWPSLDSSAGYSRTTQRTAGRGRTSASEFSLGLGASYEIDLWGRVGSTHQAARLDTEATREDLHTAAITLTAEVATVWYSLIEQQGQLALLDEQIATNEKYLEVITLKFRRGQAPATDVLQQQQLAEARRSDRVLVESRIKVMANQLAILLGTPPGRLTIKIPDKLPAPPAVPAPGVPAQLLQRRPDVRASYLRVQAADRRVAAAIANRFPRLSLTASAQTSDENVRDLFDNWLASIAANLVAPLLDGGSRRAEVDRTKAVVSERVNSYGQTVLTALGEVENALSQEAKQSQYVAGLARQLAISNKAVAQTLDNYMNGTTTFVRYLTALLSHQQLQRTHLQARRDVVLFRIDLCRALAGEWKLRAPRPAKVDRSSDNDAPADKKNSQPHKPSGKSE